MFGRRRHRAPIAVVPPVPAPLPGIEVSEEQLFERVRARLDEQIGANGAWTLVRRTDADTDTFFHDMASFSLAREITAAIVGSPARLDATPEHAAADAVAPLPTITVQSVGGSNSRPADLGATVGADVLPVPASSVPASDEVTEQIREHVMFELNTVAVWADPQRHDPAEVDAEMVTPSAPRRRWNGTRVS
ncbi:MAG: hypothetical protein ABWX65_00940 [Mycetocola sp.]